jgi:hypothetical protein
MKSGKLRESMRDAPFPPTPPGWWTAGQPEFGYHQHTPSLGELRAAGVEQQVARLRADMDALLSATWRGRLALRLSRCYARRKVSR